LRLRSNHFAPIIQRLHGILIEWATLDSFAGKD
jgi:hypothetical protein